MFLTEYAFQTVTRRPGICKTVFQPVNLCVIYLVSSTSVTSLYHSCVMYFQKFRFKQYGSLQNSIVYFSKPHMRGCRCCTVLYHVFAKVSF